MNIVAEYIWVDGSQPTQKLRSKTKVFSYSNTKAFEISDVPQWTFDGSSTGQATGDKNYQRVENKACRVRRIV